MNETRYSQTPSTFSQVFGQVLVAGVFATQMLSAPPEKEVAAHSNKGLLQDPYSWSGINATFNRYSNPITGEYNLMPNTFEQEIGNFYARLLANQERLGADFEKVLYDNIWDLYES